MTPDCGMPGAMSQAGAHELNDFDRSVFHGHSDKALNHPVRNDADRQRVKQPMLLFVFNLGPRGEGKDGRVLAAVKVGKLKFEPRDKFLSRPCAGARRASPPWRSPKKTR